MNYDVTSLSPSFLIGLLVFYWIFFILAGNKYSTTIKSLTGSKFSKIQPERSKLAALEHLEKSPQTYNGRNVVSTILPSFWDGSSPFFQVTRTTI